MTKAKEITLNPVGVGIYNVLFGLEGIHQFIGTCISISLQVGG